MLRDAFDVGWRHVDADLRDGLGVALMSFQVFNKGFDRRRILARCDKKDFALFHINDERDVVMAAASSGLIHADAGDRSVVCLGARHIHVVVDQF